MMTDLVQAVSNALNPKPVERLRSFRMSVVGELCFTVYAKNADDAVTQGERVLEYLDDIDLMPPVSLSPADAAAYGLNPCAMHLMAYHAPYTEPVVAEYNPDDDWTEDDWEVFP
jgi:hypothetical protein